MKYVLPSSRGSLALSVNLPRVPEIWEAIYFCTIYGNLICDKSLYLCFSIVASIGYSDTLLSIAIVSLIGV